MEFKELKEIAKRIERSGNIRAATDAECEEHGISMSDRLTVLRLVFLYRRYKEKKISAVEVEIQQEEIEETWETVKGDAE